jgi:S1-C subfamily serine protease
MLQLTSIAKEVGPSVVRLGRGSRRGSGVVIARDRVVVLSRSLAAAHELEVVLDEATVEAGQVLGSDRSTGLSLLKVATGDARPLEWVDGTPALGDVVYALGDPGTGLRVTEGRVSSAPVDVRGPGGRLLTGIEHTAPLPRGCGGGPLVNVDGALLGLNALRTDPGFLVASAAATVHPAVERMLAGASEQEPLGVAVAPARVARRLRQAVGLPERDGLLVREVLPGSVAERAGVSVGDLIVRLGDATVTTPDELLGGLQGVAGRLPLGVVRGADELDLEAVFIKGSDSHSPTPNQP